MLTFLWRFMRPAIENGHVYIAQPPLYQLTKGRVSRYVYSDEERDEVMSELQGDNPNAKIGVQRYKGLGEMNPEQLWDTTMNPDMRILGQVSIEDALAADELFHALMGDEVEPRKEFIDENAKLVVNLDV